MQTIKAEEVQSKLKQGLVLVRATADYCLPCKMYTPVLEQLENETNIPVYNIDIEVNPGWAAEFQIMSLPTVLEYYDGKLVGKLVGAKPLAKLKEELKPFILKRAELVAG